MFRKPPTLEDPQTVTVARARKLWLMVWIGIGWSLIYTAVSVVIMVGLYNRLQDSCQSRIPSRAVVRSVILDDPDTDANEAALINVNLPPINC